MSDAPVWSPPPPSRGPNVAGIAALALLVGAIGGAATGGYVATMRVAPGAEQSTNVATSTIVPGPIPSAPPVTASATNDVVGVVNELLPSVVTVINRLPNGVAQSSGSGFVIDATRGYVVTNNHVVENVRDSNAGASFDVIFSDNRVVKDAKLVGRDDKTDVAVLQVPPQGLKAAALANSDDAPVGSTVVAIGSALGELQNTVTSGIVSAKGRRVPETDTVVLEDLIQTDAAINEGNSGGPLIWAATKQVLGMNTLVNREAGAEGLGFGIALFYLNFLYRALGFDARAIGVLGGAQALGALAGAIPAAMLPRRMPRRSAIFVGGFVTAFGVLGILTQTALPLVFIGAALVGCGGIVVASSGTALVADATTGLDRPRMFSNQVALGALAGFVAIPIPGA